LSLKSHRRAFSCIALLLGLSSRAIAQDQIGQDQQDMPQSKLQRNAQISSADTKPDAEDDPQIPGLSSSSLHGWNAGVTFSGVHESTTGWATLVTPALGYSFNDIFSVDANLPIYSYRLAESLSTHPRANADLVTRRAELADLVFALHAQFIPPFFQYQVTGAFTVPTGDERYGLTTGRVTFDINNHFEGTFGRLTPNLEFGGGDSTTLVNRIVTKNYTSLGPLAHFQVGLVIDLLRGASFESDAYEQLPIGDQKIYGPSRKGGATVVTGHNAVEDNGFINALDLPIGRHATLSGYYSRSLRLRTDTTSIAITYVLRSPTAEDSPTKRPAK
jgi:hypothetical protein